MEFNSSYLIARFLRFCTIVCIVLLGACSEDTPHAPQNEIIITPVGFQAKKQLSVNLATWQASNNRLVLNGNSAFNAEKIKITNTKTGELLASTIADSSFQWTASIQSPATIPCTLTVTSESGTIQTVVAGAPASCDSQSVYSRAVVTNNAVIYPEALIVEPKTDLTVTINDSVDFQAGSTNVAGNASYAWQFGGAAPSSTVQNPGKVQFTQPGVYHVTLNVTDSRGLSDPTPPMRMITVTAGNINTLGAPPIANIDTPAGDQTIFVGDILNFTGSGSDPASTEPLTYLWNFDGVAPNNTMQNPGDIVFGAAGVFTIVLTVSDSIGNTGLAQVVITVVDPAQTNQPPVGMITEPAVDLTITAGDSILVEGSGTDPDGDMQLNYFWEFDGVISDVNAQMPGMVTYPNEGIYTIRLTVVDSLGLPDPNPPVRTITVQAPTASPPPDSPTGEILTPEMDTTINAGESLVFTAIGTSPVGNEPLSFLWSFDGVIPDISAQDAGAVTFPDPGVYTVSLIVLDSMNVIDPTPASRVITVLDPNAGGTPPMPVNMLNHILTPETDVTIVTGDSVNFTGMVEPEVNPPYSYLWLFDGAAPNSNSMSPGDVVFNLPGVYTVMFFAIDADGMFDSQPAMRTITVQEPGLNQASPPLGAIVEPAGDIMIAEGEVVNFVGSAIDTSGNNLLSYLWTFGGAAPSSNLLNPDPVVFSVAGNYEVSFLVIDYSDPTNLQMSTPAIVNVLVMPGANPAQPNPQPDPATGMPDGIIVSPPGDMTVPVGSSIEFIGDGINPVDNDPLNYEWDFGNGTVSNAMIPGMVTFTQVGVFTVTLAVNHDRVEFDPTPATVTITVEPTGGGGVGGDTDPPGADPGPAP